MNVGGRIGIASNQQRKIEQSSRRVQETRNITANISDNKINNSVEKDNSQMTEQIAPEEENQNSAVDQLKSKQDIDTNKRNIDNNLNLNRNNDSTFTVPRKDNNKNDAPDNQETAFEKRHEPQLIDQVKVHKVRSGETLWDIAHKHGLNIDSLIGANNISNMNSIKPGQEFKILPVKGIIYRVSPGESIGSIARKFDLKTETIMEDNNIENASSLKIDQKLILRGAKPEFSYQDRLDQKFMYPINTRITSYYGPRWGRAHEGIDFAAPMGSPIRAVSSGRVVYSGWATGYGYVVIIEHQRGLRTLYAHNSKLLVREGESVGKGEVISRSGNTGNSTGPHLHFEVQVNGRPENPLGYINK